MIFTKQFFISKSEDVYNSSTKNQVLNKKSIVLPEELLKSTGWKCKYWHHRFYFVKSKKSSDKIS